MAKDEAKIKFTAETGDFNQKIQTANNKMTELRAELRLNETQMKDTGTTVEGLEKKHKILSDQLKVSEDKTEALNQKVKKAAEIFGDNSAEATKLRTQLLNAQNAEEKLKREVEQCRTELEQQKKGINDAGEAAEESAEGFTVLKGAMADLVADGISAVVDGFKDIAKEAFTMANSIDSATNDFIAKTGASTEEAEEFEDVMTDIYNDNFGESFEDIADSMAIVKTTMGDIDTGTLKSLTEQALLMRDTFDMDVNESIRAVNSLMDQFGITADEAYSLVAQGAQKGLNQNGDLLDVVNEYAVQFKNAGYSADDMFNMLANGTAAGTWSVDKLGDAVKEFNIRASDGTVSEAIKENAKAFGLTKAEAKALATEVESGNVGAYQKLADKLREVDDDTQRYQLGVELFGTMWEDLGEDAVLSLLDTQGEISSTEDALSDINAVKYDDLGSALEGIKRNLETSVAGPIKDNVMPAVNEFIEDVDWEGVGNTIGDVFGTVVDGALALVSGIKDVVHWMQEHKAVTVAIASVIGVLTTAITAYNVVQGVKAAMDAANVTTVWALVSAHWAQATAAMAAIAPYVLIVAAIAAVIAIIVLCVKHWDEIKAKITEVAKKVKEKVLEIKNQITEKLTAAKQKAVETFENIKQSITDKITALKTKVTDTFNNIKEKIMTPINNAKEKVVSTIENLRSSFTSKVESIKSKVASAFASLKEKITKPVDEAREKIKSIVDKIKGVFDFKWSLPSLKIPKISVTGGKAPYGIAGKGSLPKFSIEWHKEGAIFKKPTVFDTRTGLHGVGEAGAEAILPIEKLKGYIADTVEDKMNVVNLGALADAIERLADRPIDLNINGRKFAEATAGDSDRVNGLRSSFLNRGLALD
jgi:phage-related minor tail protein